ncbi:MAG: hypothetical protein IPH18_12200 [Chitinophagaceae bacterium]|nr:hypothetical protein [Chitinophagaceae bacterium]MBK8951912.1 hypothetical protein [Chitinophagaceae bacterium]
MKQAFIISLLAGAAFVCSRCGNDAVAVNNMKDLDENMLDMMTYHDNLGRYIKQGDADYALWLLNGMDSSLQVIAQKFTAHRKLTDPFSTSYKKMLRPSIKGMRGALQQNNFEEAKANYRLLTKKCNGCHIDHDVDENVVDWSSNDSYK